MIKLVIMAFPASHIRFALGLVDTLQVEDMNTYVSGAVYPDSRFYTGLERVKTHPKGLDYEYLHNKSDFYKGWGTHLKCDDIQYEFFTESFTALFTKKKWNENSDEWISLTALKILQDHFDMKTESVEKYVTAISYFETPNDEDENKMSEYMSIVRNAYREQFIGKSSPQESIMRELGLDSDVIIRILDCVEDIKKSKNVVSILQNTHLELLTQAVADTGVRHGN